MAVSKGLTASLLLSLIVQADDELVNGNQAAAYPPKKIDCSAACKARCRLSGRPNLCKRACGTYGNHEACACYANVTTRGGRRKCP